MANAVAGGSTPHSFKHYSVQLVAEQRKLSGLSRRALAASLGKAPGMWGPSSVCTRGPGSLPDEILLHEIVHGMRATAGLLHCQPMGLHYDTEEEFVAVAITNVYMSERGATQLRANHLGFEPLTNVDTFYGGVMEQRQMIRRLFAQQPQFAHALSCVRAAFNPFTEHR